MKQNYQVVTYFSLLTNTDRNFWYIFFFYSLLLCCLYQKSPLILHAKCMSFAMIVTLFAWMAHMFACSRSPTRNASPASCNASTAELCNFSPSLCFCTISLTSLWKGTLQMSKSDPCYVKQCLLVLKIVPDFSKCLGFGMHFISLYGALSLHNCSSSGLLVSAHLGRINYDHASSDNSTDS